MEWHFGSLSSKWNRKLGIYQMLYIYGIGHNGANSQRDAVEVGDIRAREKEKKRRKKYWNTFDLFAAKRDCGMKKHVMADAVYIKCRQIWRKSPARITFRAYKFEIAANRWRDGKKKLPPKRKWFSLVTFIWGENKKLYFSTLRIAIYKVCADGCFRFSSVVATFDPSICYVCQWILSDFDGIEGYRSTTTKVPRNFTLYGLFVAFFMRLFFFFVYFFCSNLTPSWSWSWNNGQRVKRSHHFRFHTFLLLSTTIAMLRVEQKMWNPPNYLIPKPES